MDLEPARPRAGCGRRCFSFSQRPEGRPSPFIAFLATGLRVAHYCCVAPRRHLAHVPSYVDNPIVFFTACTHRRKAILSDPDCHEILRSIWTRSVSDGWWVGHYILMPDHVHFFARPEIGGQPMAKWVQLWKGVTSRKIAKALRILPPIWQPDYFDRYLRSAES